MSVAPEIARLAEPVVPVPVPPAAPSHSPAVRESAATATTKVTLGALAGQLRSIAATPERWWGLVRFDPDRSVNIVVEDSASHQAWLVVLPPGDAGHSCDCDAATAPFPMSHISNGTPSSLIKMTGFAEPGPRPLLFSSGMTPVSGLDHWE